MSHSLERTIVIRARPETVFRYFTDSARFAAWWGDGSRLDPRPGGEVLVRYPNAVIARGEVREIDPPTRIVFTYGYEDPQKPIPPGGSLVTITLAPHPEGTRLRLEHAGMSEPVRDAHVPGWRYQLSIFSHVVTRELHAGLGDLVDRWLSAWSERDAAARAEHLAATCTPDVIFRDAYGVTEGLEDLAAHVAALQQNMPGVRLERDGEVAQAQGTAVVGWVARGEGEGLFGRGRNVLELSPDGRIARITGIWG